MTSPYIHAALLLHFAKQTINEENLKKVLAAAGVSPDEARIKVLASTLAEVNVEEALKSASTTVATIPVPSAAPSAEAPKPKEKDDKKKEEEALAGLGALFG